ncbi:hypothetical protein PPYR_14878 [Photinus pyralis]|uniref:Angiotensin-converting enzyme n=1 Tax=Photinus pyralis TaxID=7054 RepID=A0A1Y1NHL6_PHOPY|nr:angiotensin-converting enzyme-like [Photinus pyralis]XP_031357856.1 angiotensin-converting enzyme-like [Photinus pyralis]XP_031357857.1 angiotensin-converting enzyme-like [Photinus pyralis]KAB0790846.1 hypothetical protein PPYR_14878 [Photinus pyralis]
MRAHVFVCLVSFIFAAVAKDPSLEDEEIRARAYVKLLNDKIALRNNRETLAAWKYASNITEENLKEQLDVSKESAKETKEDWLETIKFNWRSFGDYDLRRQFEKLSILGKSALPEEKFLKLEKIISDMQTIYSTAKICDHKNKTKCDLVLDPEITDILANSRDPEELKHVWVEWRHKNAPAKELFRDYVKYANEAAVLNNFTSNTGFWLYDYESPTFVQDVESIWEQLKPIYTQLHAYIRTKLRQRYGDIVSEKGPIPAHLLGNMWAQSWSNIADFTLPHPSAKRADITSELLNQGYDALKMFKTAEEFFVSLNLKKMTPEFWERSILVKPNDGRELVCHASAWDFFDKKDFRIKQCTSVNFEDFTTAHHEMGHIQYYLQYSDQPVVYRQGANDGFHEAVGDVMSLSVSSTKHLKRIGLIDANTPDNDAVDLNALFMIGLDKIAFLPFGYLMDKWRWGIFDGNITAEDYNCKWWEYRTSIQGVEPPVDRSEDDFDAAAKYHIVADVPYLRYFVSFVIQFQFHRAACELAGEYDPEDPTKPLHKCDIYHSTKAGESIAKMLQMGSSRPWPDAMEVLTGQRKMDASGLLEYFRPLHKWLEAENKKNGAYIGWESTQKKCTKRQ